MQSVGTFRIKPKSVAPRQICAEHSDYSDRQEAERRTGTAKYNLGCVGVGILVLIVCSVMSATPAGRPVATVVCLVSLFALPYTANMIIRKADVEENLRRIRSERSNALLEADQRQEEMDTYEMTQKLTVLYHNQKGNVTALHEILQQGDAAIEQAQQLFIERAYTPFWDAIEQAVGQLRRFNEGVKLIDASAKQYYGLLEGRDHNFPVFPVNSNQIPTLEGLVDRLSQVIGRAHRDFQFASIYEQRKTTSAVIAGFRSMQEAVTRLRDDILNSIDDLQQSLGSGLRTISSAIETAGEQQQEALAHLQETLDAHTAAARKKRK